MRDPRFDTKQNGSPMPTTRWTMVRAAGDAEKPEERRRALEVLANDYWPPVYAYIRMWGRSPEESEDLTQAFLVSLIERDAFNGLSDEKGKFRSWLLASLKNFLMTEKRDRNRLKRGGGAAHVSIDRDLGESWFESSRSDGASPEVVFERRWAAGILERALSRLEEACRREGRGSQYDVLAPMIAGADESGSYLSAAEELGISEGNARVTAFRFRKRLRSLVREEVGFTVASADDVESELDHFFQVFQPR